MKIPIHECLINADSLEQEKKIEVVPLARCPEYAPLLAHWTYLEWYLDRTIAFDLIVKSYRSRAQELRLPLTMVAIHEKVPSGMVSLKEKDLRAREDLGPWLGSLYVHPLYRKQGIGTLLINSVLEIAARLGNSTVYLFLAKNGSDMLEEFYHKRGWSFLDLTVDNDGHQTKIYFKNV